MSGPALEDITNHPPAPYAISFDAGGPHDCQVVLVDAAGRLLGEPLRRVGQFTPDGRGALIAPAEDLLGRWGLLDQEGRWSSEPGFGWSFGASADGLVQVLKDGRYGYLDLRGEMVIEPRFEDAMPFRHGMAVVRTAAGHGYIDRTGELLPAGPFHSARPFSAAGLAAVQVAEGGGFGFVDTTGELVIAPRYDQAKAFAPDGCAAPVRVGGEWGLIDRQGEWIVEPCHFRIEDFDAQGLAYVRWTPLATGYLDAAGRAVIRVEGEVSRVFGCGLVKHRSREDVGFLGPDGTPALGRRLTWADDFHECGASVAMSGIDRWGVLRADGRFLPVEHRSAQIDEARMALGFAAGRGLAPFVAWDGSAVYVDRDGRGSTPSAPHRRELCCGAPRLAGLRGVGLGHAGARGYEESPWPILCWRHKAFPMVRSRRPWQGRCNESTCQTGWEKSLALLAGANGAWPERRRRPGAPLVAAQL